MKTDDFNETMRNKGDDAARDRFDNQRRRYHHFEDQPEPDTDAGNTATGKHALPFELPCDIGTAVKPWVIKKVMARGEVSSWIGPPGGTKSALLIDAAIHVANGTDWRGYKIKQQRGVIYFALERVGLVRNRVQAYRRHAGIADNIPLAIVGRVIDLLNNLCVTQILDTIKAVEDRCGVEVALLIFDTYNKGIAAGAGDEDKAKDQNRVAANLRRVIERKLVHIAGVGHTGKDASRGERGSNARLADVDLQVTINGNETIRTARITKANDQDEGDLTSYALERVELGQDEDGEPIWTHIVDPLPIAAPKSNRGRKSKNQEDVCLKLLREAVDEIGERPPASNRIPQSIRVVNISTFLSGYSQGMVASSDKPDTKQKAMRRSLQKLQASGDIGVWGRYVWLTDRSDKFGQFRILSEPHPFGQFGHTPLGVSDLSVSGATLSSPATMRGHSVIN